jgi:hypothetical protein
VKVQWLWLAFALILSGAGGCSGSDDSDEVEETNDGACGARTLHDVTVVGKVLLDGEPVGEATVSLEDRSFQPAKSLAETTTTESGTFTLAVKDLESLEGCWGTVLDYWLSAELGDKSASTDMNTSLYNAVEGDGEADVSEFPLELE